MYDLFAHLLTWMCKEIKIEMVFIILSSSLPSVLILLLQLEMLWPFKFTLHISPYHLSPLSVLLIMFLFEELYGLFLDVSFCFYVSLLIINILF